MTSEKRHCKKYKCKICNKLFQKPSLLKRHEIGHSNIKPFECNECNEKFTQKSSLKRHHSDIHLKLKQFPCPKCDLRFSQYSNLNKHLERLHNSQNGNKSVTIKNDDNLELTAEDIIKELKNLQNIQYKSEDYIDVPPVFNKDSTVFSQVETIKETSSAHEKFVNIVDNLDGEKKVRTVKEIIENENKWFECNTCTKKFQRRHDLLRHFRTHTKEKKFQCDICKKSFSLKCTLRIHMKIHKKPKNLKINNNRLLNKKTFANQYVENEDQTNDEDIVESCKSKNITVLKIQEISNTEKYTQLECETCSKHFKKPIDLKRHILTHTKEKNFLCEICDKRFTLKCTLKDHMKTHSEIRTKVECQVCGKKYTNKSVLKVHIRLHFNEMPYSCEHENCTKMFRTIGHQKQHLKQHSTN